MDCLINPDRDNDKDERTTQQPSKAELEKRPRKEKTIKFQSPYPLTRQPATQTSLSLNQAIKYLSPMRGSSVCAQSPQRQVQKVECRRRILVTVVLMRAERERKAVVPFVDSTRKRLTAATG